MVEAVATREQERLAALARYEVMDTPREQSFDELAALTARLCDAPIAVVNLIGDGRQFFKAEVGLGVRETPLESSFCVKALLEEEFLVVPNLTLDTRFECNPLVTCDPHIRAYAGALLKTEDGLPIGTLCVLDYRPRPFTALQQDTLRVLARQVMSQLDLRRTVRERDQRVQTFRVNEEALALTRVELVDSEVRFRNMADHAPVMMWVTDPDGNCTYLNRQWYDFTGQTPEEAAGLGWLDVTHPDDKAPAGNIFLDANARQEPFRLEYRLRRADGMYRWAIDAASPRFGPWGEFLGYIGSVIDIGDRREAEDALREANALLSAVMEAVPGVVYAKDRAGRMLAANRGTADLVGKPLGEIIGRTDREFLDDSAQADIVMANDERVMTEQTTEVVEEEVSLPGGACATWLSTKSPFRDANGVVNGLIGSSIDITERKRAELELQRLNETLEDEVAERTAERDRIWETSPDLMVVLDFGGTFRRLNPAWTAMLGYSQSELVGHHVNEFVVPEDHDATTDAYELAADGGRPIIVNRYRHKDGSTRWISWVAVPAVDMTYATGRDITAEKDQADALRKTEEQLRQAQKMEAVGQLTGGLAHDFNNLLTGMMGNLELLQLRVARGRLDDLDRFINAAQGAGRRAASLTQRLLAFSRRQTLDPKPTDVNRLIIGLEEMLHRTVGATVGIEIVGAAGLWTADIDAPQLENAVLNLCINGRDAMPEGGKLTIETANKWVDDRIGRERDLPPGQYISICVTDTGTGMTPAAIERAFEPFYTTKPIGQGTGLGLSMIYGFARQSGGQVRIYSEVGRGTTVCIYLPRHHGEAVDSPEESATGLPANGNAQTILVVDDEATIRHLIDEVLDDLGYTVIGAADGAAGIKVLQSGARIELLITDVGLPNGMNGRQVADAARALRPGLKVLFITGFVENAAVGNGHMEPGMELLTKPFTLEALSTKVAQMLRTPAE
ncbi:PAS domain S-box protein [Sphingomonas sp. PAMC26645]|nr:PAS domain S-box protein [Sphingomonas sp. PAMC26645]QCB41151.1 PAS domain S-box protein [Sphingomonas sp. PAMC26645]